MSVKPQVNTDKHSKNFIRVKSWQFVAKKLNTESHRITPRFFSVFSDFGVKLFCLKNLVKICVICG